MPKDCVSRHKLPSLRAPRDEGWGLRLLKGLQQHHLPESLSLRAHRAGFPRSRVRSRSAANAFERGTPTQPHATLRGTGTNISALGRPRLQSWGQFGHHNIKKDLKLLESVQRRAMRMDKGLGRPWEERLRALDVFSWIRVCRGWKEKVWLEWMMWEHPAQLWHWHLADLVLQILVLCFPLW